MPDPQIVDWAPGCVAAILRPAAPPKGLALLVHGRNGAARAPWMAAIAEAYRMAGWAVVAGDLPMSSGNEAPGAAEGFTIAGHVADFARFAETVRGWGAFRETARIAYAGHSVGAFAAARVAAVTGADHLLAVSPAVSGDALLAARSALGPDALAALRREAPRAETEWPGQDARGALAALAAPLAVIVGAEDGLTPPADARAFFDAGRGRFFSALPGQHHCPEGPAFGRALAAALDSVGA